MPDGSLVLLNNIGRDAPAGADRDAWPFAQARRSRCDRGPRFAPAAAAVLSPAYGHVRGRAASFFRNAAAFFLLKPISYSSHLPRTARSRPPGHHRDHLQVRRLSSGPSGPPEGKRHLHRTRSTVGLRATEAPTVTSTDAPTRHNAINSSPRPHQVCPLPTRIVLSYLTLWVHGSRSQRSPPGANLLMWPQPGTDQRTVPLAHARPVAAACSGIRRYPKPGFRHQHTPNRCHRTQCGQRQGV